MEIGFTMVVRCNIHLPDEIELPDEWANGDGTTNPAIYREWETKAKAWLEQDLGYALNEAHYTEYELAGINLT